MYKVKLTFPYPEWDLKRQTPNSSAIWGNYQFYINQEIEECDYWFVFNHLLKDEEKVKCDRKNIILLTGEPFEIQKYNPSFISQFGSVITCQSEIKHKNVTYFHQGHPYFVGANYKNGKYSNFTKSYDELIANELVSKTKQISIITSDKLFTDGHKKRYEFCLILKDYFGDAIDLYGRGIKDFEDKWDVLADYRYSVAIENLVCPNWMTEKIYDCFLAHTFPIYYGCPNVYQYFNSKSYELIDINDLNASKSNIEKILNNNSHYEEALPHILAAKIHYLKNYNIFPLMVNHIENKLSRGITNELNMLHNNYPYLKSQSSGLIERFKNNLRSKILK